MYFILIAYNAWNVLILLFSRFRKDLTAVEIAFIRGGNSSYVPSTSQLENSINDQEDDLEENESPPLSSRSSLDHNAELNGYLNDIPHAANDIASTMHRTSPRTQQLLSQNGHHHHVNGTNIPMSSYPVHTFAQPGISTNYQPQQNGYHTSNGVNLQPRHGFNPTISSTPNDVPNGQQLPLSYGHMNGNVECSLFVVRAR